MWWSNLQPELVQQASPLKGLMQCQNLWLQGHPLFLPPQSDKSWISFPRHSFLFFLLLNSSAREAWDVRCEWNIFIRGEENPSVRAEAGANLSQWHPYQFFRFFFFLVLLTFASCHSLRYVASWLKSALCQGRHISERHKTCRNINKQQATDSSQAPIPARRNEGKVRTLGGCCAVEVSSSGFSETQGRQDKVYQVISKFKLLLGQQGNWDTVCQMICVCPRVSAHAGECFFWGGGSVLTQIPAALYCDLN